MSCCRFLVLLKGNGLDVHENLYFGDANPSLLMHFQILEAMQAVI